MEYQKEFLLSINLYDLRNIARNIGVRAPTALTKPVLIDEIMKIQSGKKEPCVPSKTGRPAIRRIDNLESMEKEESQSRLLDIIKIKKQAKRELIDDILSEIKIKLEKMI